MHVRTIINNWARGVNFSLEAVLFSLSDYIWQLDNYLAQIGAENVPTKNKILPPTVE